MVFRPLSHYFPVIVAGGSYWGDSGGMGYHCHQLSEPNMSTMSMKSVEACSSLEKGQTGLSAVGCGDPAIVGSVGLRFCQGRSQEGRRR